LAEDLDRLIEWESDVRYREPAEDVDDRIGRVVGPVPVLLSAPHGALHTRRGIVKEEEEFTAALVCRVAEMSGAYAIYTRRRSPTDPNWDRDVPYKRRLEVLAEELELQFVIDVHGTAPDRGFGMALGTMNGRSCPEKRDRILATLEAHGFGPDAAFPDRLDVDETFTGTGVEGQETVTAYASHDLGVPAAQFELHPLLRVVERREDASLPRPFHGDPARIERVIEMLVALVAVVGAEQAAEPTVEGAEG
jgi:hypothetical protein